MELITHFNLEQSHSVKEKKTKDAMINDIYDLFHLTTASETAFNNQNVTHLFDIKLTNLPIKINNIQELHDSLKKTISDNHKFYSAQLQESKILICAQSRKKVALNEQNNNIIKQNNALKEELKKVYLETLKNKTQTNQINYPSSQNFPMGSYASSLTYNLNNTPQSSNTRKRPNEAVAEESARKKIKQQITLLNLYKSLY